MAILADDIVVKYLIYLVRSRQLAAGAGAGLLLNLLADDVVAEIDALVADKHRWSRDELAHLVLALAAERAVQQPIAIATFSLLVVAHGPTS